MSNHETSLNIDTIQNIQSQLNDRLLKMLKKAIVFADNQFMEWFTLTSGIDYLTKSGLSNIKEFSSFENGEDHLKGVFFLAQPLKGMCLETLKDIICSSKFRYVIVITSVNPTSYDQTLDYFDQIRDDCLIWMKDVNNECEIKHERFPFAFLPQTSDKNLQSLLFLNPLSSWSVYSDNFNQLVNLETYSRLVKQELNELSSNNAATSNFKDHLQQYYNHLSSDHLNELKSLAHSLNEMLDHLDAKEDCFSLGILSALVANELNLSSGSKHRKKTGNNKVSVLLIDRNLDLAVTSLFHEETVFDKINNLMPNLNSNSNDLQVNLSEFIFDNKFKAILPGNLFHFSSESCSSLIEMFLTSKPKECLLEAYRKLCEIFPQSEREKKTFRINTESLKTQMKNGLKTNKKIFFDNIDLIQIVSMYCQINDSKYTKQVEFEKIIANIKVLNQNIFNKEGPSVLTRIYTLFSERAEQTDKVVNYSVSDLLMLLIYAYTLIGEECFYGSEEEDRVKKLLVDELKSNAFLNDPRFSSDREFIFKIKENMNQSQLVDKIFVNLKALKHFRKNLKQHSKLVVKEESKSSFEFKPLIKQVCENIIKTKVNNVPDQLLDIEYRTTNPSGEGFQNLFKSFKIGYLMNSAVKAHPLNNGTLIVYFVGGITSYEMKIVKEMFSKEKDFNVIVGSSHFYNHNKLAKYLLF